MANVNCESLHELRKWERTLKTAIEVLHREWMKRPHVSPEKKTALQLEQNLIGEVLREKTNLVGSAGFKVLNSQKPMI